MSLYENKSPEDRIKKLIAENRSLKEKISLLRSENENLRKSIKWSDVLLNSNPAGIIILQQGKTTYMNRTMLDQLGYKNEDVIGRKFIDFLHPDYVKTEGEFYKKLFAGKKIQELHETHFTTHEGEAICCDTRIKSKRLKGKKAFILNLTRAEKRKEKERENLISVKNEALKTMALGMKNKLTSRIDDEIMNSSDLRTMLASEESNMIRNLENIRDSVYKTQRVSEILELLSIEKLDKEGWELISISEIVKDAVSETMGKCSINPQSNIDIKTYLRSKSLIKGDSEKIRDVVVNMILNSIEAMPNGGEIHVTTEDNAGEAHLYIQDTGEGIHDRFKSRIFDPFFTTRREKGRGLGLSLCYSIVKHHKGAIEMTSTIGQGAMFEIRIPLPKIKAKKTPKSSSNIIKNIHILLIQDEDFVRELMAQLFSNKGCKVDTVVSGLEGLGKIKKGRWDLVIADTELPDVDRETFLKKGRIINPNMPIVLLDGHKDERSSVGSIKTTADLIFTKPLDVNFVVDQVMELVIEGD